MPELLAEITSTPASPPLPRDHSDSATTSFVVSLGQATQRAPIFVRWVSIAAMSREIAGAWTCLGTQEIARAQRFHRARDRLSYLARHVWARRQLAEWLGVAPAALRFALNEFGKPALQGCSLAFNMSSSADVALLVFGEVESLGCDVEYCDPLFSCEAASGYVFSHREQLAYRNLASEERLESFFKAWTCKEAYTKALGCGLSLDPRSVEVDVRPSGPARLLSALAGFSVTSFKPCRSHRAAIVARK